MNRKIREYMQIKDIMKRDVIAVPLDAPVADVANLLIKHRIHAVPVVDEQRKVVGIISETDFFLKNSFALHLPTYLEIMKQVASGKDASWESRPEFQVLIHAQAKDLMNANCITLPETAEIEDVLNLVRQHHYKSFPVTDYQGILIGIVTLIDAVSASEVIKS